MPPYRPYPHPGFGGGVNLRDAPDVVDPQQAIDLLNVVFNERGTVKTRDGFGVLNSAAMTNQADSLHAYQETDGTRQLLVGAGTRLEGMSTAGSVIASATGLAGGPYGFASFGSPATEVAYAGNGQDTLRKWDGATWSAPTGTVDGVATRALPRGSLLAVDSDDNRLIVAGFDTTTGGPHGATTNPSTVFFSEVGDPQAWLTSSYVHLRPGDGEKIMGIAAWRGQIFIFKETSFFVFTGVTVAGTGVATFNYRPVDAGVGCVSRKAVAVGREGVYFLDRTGIYRTTGAEPELVSGVLDPLFQGQTSIYYQGEEINHSALNQCAMHWHDERVYLAVPTAGSATNNRTLVFDPRFGWWSIFDIAASDFATFRVSASPELVFGFPTGAKKIGRHASGYSSDHDGTDTVAITSRWRSGWLDLGSGENKTIREAKIWGSGQVTIRPSEDYRVAAAIGKTVTLSPGADTWGDGSSSSDLWGDGTSDDTWGPSGAITGRLVRGIAIRGTVFSFEFFSNTENRPFAVHRFQPHLREVRPPSTIEAA